MLFYKFSKMPSYTTEPPGQLDVQIKFCKKMKKRKQLDALVSGVKPGKRFKSSSFANGASHGLLKNYSESSDLEEYNTKRKRPYRKNMLAKRMCTAFFPVIVFILVTACIIATATLVWLHLILRSNLDILRLHLQKVESDVEDTPEALHTIHTQIKKTTTDLENLKIQTNKAILDVQFNSKEVVGLKKTTIHLEESLATAPVLQGLPKTIETLSVNIASIGSKILALDNTVKDLKAKHIDLQNERKKEIDDLEDVKKGIHDLWTDFANAKRTAADSLSKPTNTTNSTHLLNHLEHELNILNNGFTHLNGSQKEVTSNYLKTLKLYQTQQKDLSNLQDFVFNNLTEVITNIKDTLDPKPIFPTFNSSIPPENWPMIWKDMKELSLLYVKLQQKLSLPLNHTNHTVFSTDALLEGAEKYFDNQLKNLSSRINLVEQESERLRQDTEHLNHTSNTCLEKLKELPGGSPSDKVTVSLYPTATLPHAPSRNSTLLSIHPEEAATSTPSGLNSGEDNEPTEPKLAATTNGSHRPLSTVP